MSDVFLSWSLLGVSVLIFGYLLYALIYPERF